MSEGLKDKLPEGWGYSTGRKELYCPHGIGHPVEWSPKATHGCDGCCDTEEFRKAQGIVANELGIEMKQEKQAELDYRILEKWLSCPNCNSPEAVVEKGSMQFFCPNCQEREKLKLKHEGEEA